MRPTWKSMVSEKVKRYSCDHIVFKIFMPPLFSMAGNPTFRLKIPTTSGPIGRSKK